MRNPFVILSLFVVLSSFQIVTAQEKTEPALVSTKPVTTSETEKANGQGNIQESPFFSLNHNEQTPKPTTENEVVPGFFVTVGTPKVEKTSLQPEKVKLNAIEGLNIVPVIPPDDPEKK